MLIVLDPLNIYYQNPLCIERQRERERSLLESRSGALPWRLSRWYCWIEPSLFFSYRGFYEKGSLSYLCALGIDRLSLCTLQEPLIWNQLYLVWKRFRGFSYQNETNKCVSRISDCLFSKLKIQIFKSRNKRLPISFIFILCCYIRGKN